jgi:hypothetical protein
VLRIEATGLHCTRSEEVEECGRRLLGDGLLVDHVVEVGQRVLGVGGGDVRLQTLGKKGLERRMEEGWGDGWSRGRGSCGWCGIRGDFY